MSATGPAAPDDIFTDNERWGNVDDWNETAVRLHEQGGFHRIERKGFRPFWAVIDHEAIREISRQNGLFTNLPAPILGTADTFGQNPVKSLVQMDDPEHDQYRRLTNDWFKAKSVRLLDPRLVELGREAVSKLESFGGECDFAVDIALPFPLQVILKLLGLPEEDYPRMLQLTQEMFGQEDPDLQRAEASPEVLAEVVGDLFRYFNALTADRRAKPREDLASLIANGQIDGAPMPEFETNGYYAIVATAGHDTTSSAMAGGMQALIEHPEQLRSLKSDLDRLLPNAVEEMLRWTSPVRHFMRTAQVATEVRGQKIEKGDWLYLSYKAANLDPKVFPDPLHFDIERANAREHVAFGYGGHFCLGAQLARMELRRLFEHILPRIDWIELAGPVKSMKTTFVGGTKNLPIRYELTTA